MGHRISGQMEEVRVHLTILCCQNYLCILRMIQFGEYHC